MKSAKRKVTRGSSMTLRPRKIVERTTRSRTVLDEMQPRTQDECREALHKFERFRPRGAKEGRSLAFP